MKVAPLPVNEAERIASLRRMMLLSTPAEEMLDCITRMACRSAEIPIALISLVDHDRQWFKSRTGLDVNQTGRDVSFCAHAILQDEVFIIPNALEDERFHDNPFVVGPPFLRSYAGMPLKNAEGYKIGTLCLLDSRPRQFTISDIQIVRDLAKLAEMALENRRLGETQMRLIEELTEARREALLCPLTQAWNRRGFDALYERDVNACARQGRPFAVAALDIDRFKSINDTHGHPVGDRVIRRLAEILRGCSRCYDVVARVGGEEFFILMPNLPSNDAHEVGEKLLQAVRSEGLIPVDQAAGPPDRFTVSIGMACVPADCAREPQADVLAKADEALYAAKRLGRDRLVIVSYASSARRNVGRR